MTVSAVNFSPVKIDWTAQTVLPMEFQGREVELEARAYRGDDETKEAMVLLNRATNGDANKLPLVRVHSGCVTGDIFHSLRCDCYAQLQASLQEIIEKPNGVLIYLPYHEGRGIGLVNKIKAYALQDKGFDTVDANVEIGAPIDARDYDLAAAILRDLGFPRIRLLSNNPEKVAALAAEGIDIVEQVPVQTKPQRHNARYLETKKTRMSHKL